MSGRENKTRASPPPPRRMSLGVSWGEAEPRPTRRRSSTLQTTFKVFFLLFPFFFPAVSLLMASPTLTSPVGQCLPFSLAIGATFRQGPFFEASACKNGLSGSRSEVTRLYLPVSYAGVVRGSSVAMTARPDWVPQIARPVSPRLALQNDASPISLAVRVTQGCVT